MASVILADLIRDGRLLWIYCRHCGRERDMDPATLPLHSVMRTGLPLLIAIDNPVDLGSKGDDGDDRLLALPRLLAP